MSILVTYGSKRGGTAGLAQMIVDELQSAGQTADVVPARQARSLEGYDAVVVGGALYALRWHRDAKRFVKRHAAELRRIPTFFFSSGPLDDSAAKSEIPPVKGVQVLMDRVGAKKHMTFGGRLVAEPEGWPASAMAKTRAGDWRDSKQVRDWVAQIDFELRARASHV